jgi:hypothetical protein
MRRAQAAPSNLIQAIMMQFLTIHNEPSYKIIVKSVIPQYYRVLIRVVDKPIMF